MLAMLKILDENKTSYLFTSVFFVSALSKLRPVLPQSDSVRLC